MTLDDPSRTNALRMLRNRITHIADQVTAIGDPELAVQVLPEIDRLQATVATVAWAMTE